MKNMNLFLLLVFFIKIPLLLFSSGELLGGDYPFSFKTGYNTAITFMTNRDVAIYNVASPISPASLDATESCSSTEEKGAIYLDGYYYLSCLYGTNQFEIKIYDKSFIFHKKRGPYTLKTGSSISFFIKYSSQVGLVIISLFSIIKD